MPLGVGAAIRLLVVGGHAGIWILETLCRYLSRSLEGKACKSVGVSRPSPGKRCGWSRVTKAPSAPASDPPEARLAAGFTPLLETKAPKAIFNGKHQLIARHNHRAVHTLLPYSTAKSAIMVAMYTIFGRQVGSHYVCQACLALIKTAVPSQSMKLFLRSKTKANWHPLSLQLALATLVGTGAIATWAVSGEKKQPTPVNQSSNKDEEEFIQYVVSAEYLLYEEGNPLPPEG